MARSPREVVPTEAYEYRYVELLDTDIDAGIDELNNLGTDGWLVNTFVHSGGHYRFLLVRKI